MYTEGIYENISQRAVSSYRKHLADFNPTTGLDEAAGVAQRDLHAFFKAFYEDVYAQPQAYGLPLSADLSIGTDEPYSKDKKQLVKQKLDKPRGMLDQALSFLMLAGIRGRLEGSSLVLDDYPTVVKESKIGPKFIKALAGCGLKVEVSGARALLSNPKYPAMMSALKNLALACAVYKDERTGKFHFARCDFRALDPNYQTDVLELYRVFGPEDFERVAQLHSFFSAKGYKTSLAIGGPFSWTVQYQGNRKIKGSPFFQVTYEYRYENPLRPQIKCASTNRLADLLPQQPPELLDDFIQRAYPCQGDKCGWCKTRPHLGPTDFVYKGETKRVCWYSNGDINHLDDHALELVKQYAFMHDQLLPEN